MYIHYRFVKDGKQHVLEQQDWESFVRAMRYNSWSLKHIFYNRDFMVHDRDEKEVLEWCMSHHIEVEPV